MQDHLKKIFTKVDVRSRCELIARIDNDHDVRGLVEGGALAPSGWFAGPSTWGARQTPAAWRGSSW